MKRPLLITLIIGIFVVVGVSAMHLSSQVVRFEDRVADYISSYNAATHVVPKQWQYLFMSILSFGVAALTVTSLRRGRIGLLAIGLLIELVAVSWICSLYRDLATRSGRDRACIFQRSIVERPVPACDQRRHCL